MKAKESAASFFALHGQEYPNGQFSVKAASFVTGESILLDGGLAIGGQRL